MHGAVKRGKEPYQDVWSKKKYDTYNEARNERIKSIESLEKENSRKRKLDTTTTVSFDINNSSFTNKIELLPEDKKTKKEIYRRSKEILTHRSDTNFEDLVFIDSKNGKSVINKNCDIEKGVKMNKQLKQFLKDAEEYSIIGIHNHPNNMMPSASDLFVAKQRKYKYGLCICHNGQIYKYTIKDEADIEMSDFLIDILQKEVYNSNRPKVIKILKTLEDYGVQLEIL